MPATEATSSRNIQDFKIVSEVSPLNNSHYSVWDPVYFEVNVQSNASTPIGGRSIIAEVCSGNHVSTATCPSIEFTRQAIIQTLNPNEIRTVSFVDPFYASEYTDQNFTVVFRFSSEDIRPEDDRFAVQFFMDENFQDIIYMSNNLTNDEIFNPEVDYQSKITVSSISWPSDDQIEVGWKLKEIDVSVAVSSFCLYVGSGLFENIINTDVIPPYLAIEAFSVNDVINATFNATSLSVGENYSLRWQVVTDSIVNNSHVGEYNWMSDGNDVSIQMNFSGLEDGLHCVRGEVLIPRMSVSQSLTNVNVSGSFSSLEICNSGFEIGRLNSPNKRTNVFER